MIGSTNSNVCLERQGVARRHKVEKYHPEGKNVFGTTNSPYEWKTAMVEKILGKSDISKDKNEKEHRQFLGNYVYRRTIGRRAAASVKAENENETK